MQFKEFSLLAQGIESGEVLKAIETAIPPEIIEQVLNQTDSGETRKRKLPSHLSLFYHFRQRVFRIEVDTTI
ncbi:transposase domain-containing protein [Chlorogloea sp. CCALA 695]